MAKRVLSQQMAKEEPLAVSQLEDSAQEQNGGKRYIEIRRGTVDSLLVCEITEYEKEIDCRFGRADARGKDAE